MRSTRSSRTVLRVPPLVLGFPLVLGSGIAYLALSESGRGERLPVAPGLRPDAGLLRLTTTGRGEG